MDRKSRKKKAKKTEIKKEELKTIKTQDIGPTIYTNYLEYGDPAANGIFR